MAIVIPKPLRAPVRVLYLFLGGMSLIGLGLPWCVVSWCLLPYPIFSGFIWGLGLPSNCVMLLLLLHRHGAIAPGIAPWEFGLLGWSIGMGFLLVCAWLEQVARGDGVDGRLCAMLLKPFGVELRVKSVGLGTFIWVIPLLATMFSAAATFIASWISYPQTVLDCSDVQLPMGSAVDLCVKLRGSMHAILDHQNHCCSFVDRTFDLTEFLSSVGGNVVAAYGTVKILGTVGVATATDVELDSDPPQEDTLEEAPSKVETSSNTAVAKEVDC